MTKRIDITVKQNGEVKLETTGFTGKSCMQVDKILETLGDKIRTEKTADYFKEARPNDVNIVGI